MCLQTVRDVVINFIEVSVLIDRGFELSLVFSTHPSSRFDLIVKVFKDKLSII